MPRSFTRIGVGAAGSIQRVFELNDLRAADEIRRWSHPWTVGIVIAHPHRFVANPALIARTQRRRLVSATVERFIAVVNHGTGISAGIGTEAGGAGKAGKVRSVTGLSLELVGTTGLWIGVRSGLLTAWYENAAIGSRLAAEARGTLVENVLASFTGFAVQLPSRSRPWLRTAGGGLSASSIWLARSSTRRRGLPLVGAGARLAPAGSDRRGGEKHEKCCPVGRKVGLSIRSFHHKQLSWFTSGSEDIPFLIPPEVWAGENPVEYTLDFVSPRDTLAGRPASALREALPSFLRIRRSSELQQWLEGGRRRRGWSR